MSDGVSSPHNTIQNDAALATALRRYGICHLLSAEPAALPDDLDASTLIVGLANHTDPRFRQALIALFLRHPELSEQVHGLLDQLPSSAADSLRHLYTAAVYLQRLWRNLLRLHLGRFRMLPDHFGQAYYHLPPPDVAFGEAGLRSLARLYSARTGFDWTSIYQTTMTLFLQQLSLEQGHYD